MHLKMKSLFQMNEMMITRLKTSMVFIAITVEVLS